MRTCPRCMGILATLILAADPMSAQGNAPQITALSPATRSSGSSGFTLTVQGRNFRDGALVRWNGSNRTTTVVSDSQARATIPASDLASPGVASVTVSVRVGQQDRISEAVSFPIVLIPVIGSVSPATALAGGEPLTLTVNGSRFAPDAVVRWDGSDRATTYVSATQITALIPAGDLAVPEGISITVSNPGPSGGLSAPRSYSVAHLTPTISSLDPSKATAASSAFTLTVNGQNFIRNGSSVRWNGSDRTTTFVSPTQLQAAIPASLLTSGTKTITVRTQIGQAAKTSDGRSLVVEANVVSMTATPVQLVRLAEERLAERGQFAGISAADITILDCQMFGTSHVMVGIKGRSGWALDELQVGCQKMLAGGTLETTRTAWTAKWDMKDEGGTPFALQQCEKGSVVVGVEGTVDFGQLRSITLHCRQINAQGLATGAVTSLTKVGGNVGRDFGPDACTSNRPVRAFRVSTHRWQTDDLRALASPWVVAGLQLICQPPVVPSQ